MKLKTNTGNGKFQKGVKLGKPKQLSAFVKNWVAESSLTDLQIPAAKALTAAIASDDDFSTGYWQCNAIAEDSACIKRCNGTYYISVTHGGQLTSQVITHCHADLPEKVNAKFAYLLTRIAQLYDSACK